MGSEWPQCRLEDLASPDSGAIAIGPFGSRLKADCYVEEGVGLIRGTNVSGSTYLSGNFVYISEATASTLGNANLKPDDLVFPHRGSIGAVGIVPDDGRRYALSTSLMKISLDPNRAVPGFYYYYFRSSQGRSELLKNASQVGTPGIATPLTSLRGCMVPCPSVDDQLRAIGILSALDGRIELLRQTNTTLEAIAQALFKSWFVDFDPVRAKAEGREPETMDAATAALFPSEFEESELGLIPKGWERSSLGDVCAAKGGCIQTGPFGSQLHASDYVPVGVPVVMPQDLAGRRVAEDKVARVPSSDADRLARHQLRSGDIVFSRRGDVGRHAVVSEGEVGWLCGTGCLLVRPGESESISTFVSAALARPGSLEWLARNAVGATMPNLNTKILSRLPIISPPDEFVRAFERIASPLEHRVSANHAQIKSLADLRDTLLPRLISGKLRLPDAEASIEEATP